MKESVKTHPSQAFLQCVKDDELRKVKILLRGFSKYPLLGKIKSQSFNAMHNLM